MKRRTVLQDRRMRKFRDVAGSMAKALSAISGGLAKRAHGVLP
jgi:hypothetical protein